MLERVIIFGLIIFLFNLLIVPCLKIFAGAIWEDLMKLISIYWRKIADKLEVEKIKVGT